MKMTGLTRALVCAGLVGMAMSSAQAANWTMLQGTEKAGTAPRMKMWGFIQPTYEKDTSDKNDYTGALPGNNFAYIAPKLIGPDLDSQEGFNIRRARIGARGTGFPLDSSVNYFFLAEFGNNAITHGGGGSAKITDASITLNHIPGARVRMGTFKVPTFEEGYQAIHVFDYINFTTVGNQMMLERFPNRQWTANRNNTAGFDYTDTNDETPYNLFEQPVSAFRDTGIQIFDAFKTGSWTTTYAAMYGNGNGMNSGDNDDNKDAHLYVSTEMDIAGGVGPWKHGWKFFVWQQDGDRTLYNPAVPVGNDTEPGGKQEYERKRAGVGTKYWDGQFRFTAEYLKGEGMIFLGPDNPTFTQTAPSPPLPVLADTSTLLIADGRKGKAEGYYVDFGWRIPNSGWQFDIRYDVYDRLVDQDSKFPGSPPPLPCGLNTVFKTTTIGTNYHFNRKSRLTLNVADRDFNSPDCPDPTPSIPANPNNNLDGMDLRYSLQLTHIF